MKILYLCPYQSLPILAAQPSIEVLILSVRICLPEGAKMLAKYTNVLATGQLLPRSDDFTEADHFTAPLYILVRQAEVRK
jgi:hypothetical protein